MYSSQNKHGGITSNESILQHPLELHNLKSITKTVINLV